MELFDEQNILDFIKIESNKIKNEISKLTNSQIQNISFDELIEYYQAKYYIEPLNLLVDKKTLELNECEITFRNPFKHSIYEPEYFKQPGYKITFKIPFEGDSRLLYLKPTMCILRSFEIDIVEMYDKEHLPCILYSLEISSKELDKEPEQAKYIESNFKKDFSDFITMSGSVNSSIHSYNKNLPILIKNELDKQKSKSSNFLTLAQNLNIDLSLNDKAPNLDPIPLKLKKEIKTFPRENKPEENHIVKESDYINIKQIISLACSSFEHTPSACQKLDEEELRDMLLSNLNTHYNATATGETFSKNGKTDIRIQFENKSAYIAECKIWHGISKFREAITQLFSYTTWRDIKTSLIVFNKEVKDFSSILNKINEELKKNPLKISITEISKNEWQCIFKKSMDSSEKIALHVIVCDVSV